MNVPCKPRIRIGAGALAAALALGACSSPGPDARGRAMHRTSAGPYVSVTRGRYLARLGDCKDCHTAKGGEPWAGGRAVPTPFGIIYSTNITPDPSTGIGNWTYRDFYRAMHAGVSRDGSNLYPAFPYPWFTHMTRRDVYDLKAYLDTVTPVHQRKPDNKLMWPLGYRTVMTVWNRLYFDAGTYQPDPDKSAQWNRGAYLVRGIAHCGACHTGRNFAGASDMSDPFQGGMAEHVFAPDLTSDPRTGLGNWSVDEIVEYLGTGSNDITSAAGPMATVVHMSTQYMSKSDRQAIAVYLKSIPAAHPEREAADNHIDESIMRAGKAVYVDNCQGCHMDDGKGLKHVFPPLRGSSAILAAKPQTLIQAVLAGAKKPATKAKPTGLAMPAFDRKLSNAQVAHVLTYIRNSWGNHASAVSPGTVGSMRDTSSSTPH